MEELKPCPFCGAEAKIYRVTEESMPDNIWIVGCDGIHGSLCPCYIWKCNPIYVGEELAIRMWNKRIFK